MSETDLDTCDACALAEHPDHHERAYRRVRRVRMLCTAMTAGALALTGAGVLTGTAAYVYGALAVVTILLGWHVLDRRHDTPLRREVTIARAQYARTAPPPESIEDEIQHEYVCLHLDRLDARLPWWSLLGS